MLKLNHSPIAVLVSVSALASFSYGGGVFNVQTAIVPKKQQSLEKLREEERRIDEVMEDYKSAILEENSELKTSIKKLKMLVELKKDTLVSLKKTAKQTQNTKEIRNGE